MEKLPVTASATATIMSASAASNSTTTTSAPITKPLNNQQKKPHAVNSNSNGMSSAFSNPGTNNNMEPMFIRVESYSREPVAKGSNSAISLLTFCDGSTDDDGEFDDDDDDDDDVDEDEVQTALSSNYQQLPSPRTTSSSLVLHHQPSRSSSSSICSNSALNPISPFLHSSQSILQNSTAIDSKLKQCFQQQQHHHQQPIQFQPTIMTSTKPTTPLAVFGSSQQSQSISMPFSLTTPSIGLNENANTFAFFPSSLLQLSKQESILLENNTPQLMLSSNSNSMKAHSFLSNSCCSRTFSSNEQGTHALKHEHLQKQQQQQLQQSHATLYEMEQEDITTQTPFPLRIKSQSSCTSTCSSSSSSAASAATTQVHAFPTNSSPFVERLSTSNSSTTIPKQLAENTNNLSQIETPSNISHELTDYSNNCKTDTQIVLGPPPKFQHNLKQPQQQMQFYSSHTQINTAQSLNETNKNTCESITNNPVLMTPPYSISTSLTSYPPLPLSSYPPLTYSAPSSSQLNNYNNNNNMKQPLECNSASTIPSSKPQKLIMKEIIHHEDACHDKNCWNLFNEYSIQSTLQHAHILKPIQLQMCERKSDGLCYILYPAAQADLYDYYIDSGIDDNSSTTSSASTGCIVDSTNTAPASAVSVKSIKLEITDAERYDLLEFHIAMQQTSRALAYLHDTVGIAHCDIKPENIFKMSSKNFVLADFGIARRTSQNNLPDSASKNTRYEQKPCCLHCEPNRLPNFIQLSLDSQTNTASSTMSEFPTHELCAPMSLQVRQSDYFSPELEELYASRNTSSPSQLQSTQNAKEQVVRVDEMKADVFAFGMTFFVCLFNSYPYETSCTLNDPVYQLLCDPSKKPFFWRKFLVFSASEYQRFQLSQVPRMDLLIHLFEGMLHHDPKQRFTAQQVASHPWLQLKLDSQPKPFQQQQQTQSQQQKQHNLLKNPNMQAPNTNQQIAQPLTINQKINILHPIETILTSSQSTQNHPNNKNMTSNQQYQQQLERQNQTLLNQQQQQHYYHLKQQQKQQAKQHLYEGQQPLNLYEYKNNPNYFESTPIYYKNTISPSNEIESTIINRNLNLICPPILPLINNPILTPVHRTISNPQNTSIDSITKIEDDEILVTYNSRFPSQFSTNTNPLLPSSSAASSSSTPSKGTQIQAQYPNTIEESYHQNYQCNSCNCSNNCTHLAAKTNGNQPKSEVVKSFWNFPRVVAPSFTQQPQIEHRNGHNGEEAKYEESESDSNDNEDDYDDHNDSDDFCSFNFLDSLENENKNSNKNQTH